MLCCCRGRITCCLLSTVRVYVIKLHVRVGFVRLCGVSSSPLCIADVVCSVVGWGGSFFLSWSGVGGVVGSLGYCFWVFSKASKILFGVMLNSSFQWLLIENSL